MPGADGIGNCLRQQSSVGRESGRSGCVTLGSGGRPPQPLSWEAGHSDEASGNAVAGDVYCRGHGDQTVHQARGLNSNLSLEETGHRPWPTTWPKMMETGEPG